MTTIRQGGGPHGCRKSTSSSLSHTTRINFDEKRNGGLKGVRTLTLSFSLSPLVPSKREKETHFRRFPFFSLDNPQSKGGVKPRPKENPRNFQSTKKKKEREPTTNDHRRASHRHNATCGAETCRDPARETGLLEPALPYSIRRNPPCSHELLEVACNHFRILGFSTGGFATTTTVRESNLTWVIVHIHIDIYKYPAWSDVVEIETWYEVRGPIWAGRYWILKDCATSEVIGRATSKWVIMNQDTRRLEKISDDAQEEYLAFSPREPRLAFPEEKNGSPMKITKLEKPAEYSRPGLMPTRADLDMNQHVNNVTYISWVLEGMPQEIIDTHEIKTITLDYRRECRNDDVVDSLTSSESFEDTQVSELNGSNGLAAATTKGSEEFRQFLHLLRLSGNGHEISRGRTKWRKKQNKIYPNHSV